MKRWYFTIIAMLVAILCLTGCSGSSKNVKIGVSMGVGPATRWEMESDYMAKKAEELGTEIEIRLNKNEQEKTQYQDCVELVDSGIDVLILMPRNAADVSDILDYAKKKKVPVLSYARIVLGEDVDLFVGYDCNVMGQEMGRYLSETVYEGNYIILQGDPNDNNAKLIYEGAKLYIDPIRENINVILEDSVAGWSAELAKEMVIEAVQKADGKIDAILAPNDALARGCIEALEELNVTNHVVITGMDAELESVRYIAQGKQDMTLYMDLQELAETAVQEAIHMATGEKVHTNAEMYNQSNEKIDANLIVGKVVVRENLDRILIESGHFTHEEVYGK